MIARTAPYMYLDLKQGGLISLNLKVIVGIQTQKKNT